VLIGLDQGNNIITDPLDQKVAPLALLWPAAIIDRRVGRRRKWSLLIASNI
jgi:hypothetical protein